MAASFSTCCQQDRQPEGFAVCRLIKPCLQGSIALLVTRRSVVHSATQDKVQDLLSQQLDATDNEAVLQELQQLEDLALQEEMQHMPAVPKTEPQQAQQQAAQTAAAAAAASTAAAEAAVQIEEELPSVPATKVRWL
jgi:hypothetical protein